MALEQNMIPEIKLSYKLSCDVLVVGGGASGCSAALTASRFGAEVILIEKNGCLGGSSVSQGVSCILSKNTVDFQGIWHEYMKNLQSNKGVYDSEFRYSKDFDFHCTIDPEIVKFTWEDMLLSSNVKLLYHSTVINVYIDGSIIKGILSDCKGVRTSIAAKRIIDCSGDGVVACYAGVPWDQGSDNNKYAMSLTKVLRVGNVNMKAGPVSQQDYERVEENWRNAVERGEYKNPIITTGRILYYIKPFKSRWKMPAHMNQFLLVPSRLLKVDPLNPVEMSKAEIEGRNQAREIADFYRKYVPGFENSYIVETNQHIGVRSSRRLKGIETVSAYDAICFNKYSDSIARASWDIDVWPADSYTAPPVPWDTKDYAVRLDKLQHGEYFDIKYGCIVAKNIENLLFAGRIISAENTAQSSLRIQQTCMATGEAAGLASIRSILKGVSPSALNGVSVADELVKIREKTMPAFSLIIKAWKLLAEGNSIRDLEQEETL